MVDVTAIPVFEVVISDRRVENDSVKQESNRTVVDKKNKKGGHEKRKKEQKAAYGHRWLLTTLKGHSGTVLNLDFSGNGKYLASCADGGPICWKGGVGGNSCGNQSRRQQVNHQQNQPHILNNLRQPNNHANNMESVNHNNNNNNNNRNHKKTRNHRNNVKNHLGFEPIPVIKTNILWPNFYGARPPLQAYCSVVLQGMEVYQQLSGYILTRDEMKRCGYPVESPNTPGKIEFANSSPRKDVDAKPNLKPEEKLCYRCNSKFIVTEEGHYEADDTCSYHFGRFKPADCVDPKTPAPVYSCCAGAVDSPGCAWSRFHIAQQASDNPHGFVKTREKKLSNSPKDGVLGPGVYALDCEMCYTWAGLEVTKVTVVGPDGFVIYDSLVLPEHPIVDYNTNYSGITANDMKNVTTTLYDVHAVLLKLFSSKTILIGHGLENDLKALKLLHETIVDTSVIFPHYYGLPYRRSLKSLMTCYLQKTIQDGAMGHDSAEDARACMELMLWKVLQDRQMR